MIIRFIICLIVGYALGCFQTGFIVGKANKMDIREHGSGNAGTTNAFRTMGKKAGIITFLGDFLKAFIPIMLIKYVLFPGQEYTELLEMVFGVGCVMGHNFPFYLKFKGGKGVAVTAGVFIGIDLWIAIPGFLIFGLVVFFTKYVSLASLTAVCICPLWVVVTRFGKYETGIYAAMIVVSLLFLVSAIIRHYPNIKRLMNGTENKIGEKAKT